MERYEVEEGRVVQWHGAMELKDLQQHWTAFGEQDPLWAILTAPGKRGGGWDLDEFFATGRTEVKEVLDVTATRGIVVNAGRALDFGCGVGRLTRALAEHFESCDGVDVAATMIERAVEFNQNGERVRFHHNDASDLSLFADESFDFVLALIVLQHMQPELMRGYMREFLRVLRPAGVAFFNIPERFELADELPPEAWRASLALIGSIPALTPGQIAPVKLTVRNQSPAPWPSSAQLRAGDHWLTSDGALVAFDDARAVIHRELGPGEECELQLDVTAPGQPGQYVLEVDLLQEWVAWFADRGSATLKLEVPVGPDDATAAAELAQASAERLKAPPRAVPNPRMEMHFMSREDVVATLEEAGGVVLDVMPRDRCGAAIPSVDYVVARALSLPRGPAGNFPPESSGVATDPEIVAQRRRARLLMDDRIDLVEFDLTSSLGRLGRASVSVRTAFRRVLHQVLRRQTEFNEASSERIRSLETQLEAVAAVVERRLHALERARVRDAEQATELGRRIARLEVDAVMLARRTARDLDAPPPES